MSVCVHFKVKLHFREKFLRYDKHFKTQKRDSRNDPEEKLDFFFFNKLKMYQYQNKTIVTNYEITDMSF